MLVLGPRMRIVCIVLQVMPPGLGAIIAGAKNPHTRYLKRGIAQMILVVFGSWPLIVPGAIGVVWAWTDAYRIGRDARLPPHVRPTPDADPDTVAPTAADTKAARQRAASKRRQARDKARKEKREAKIEDDDTRFLP